MASSLDDMEAYELLQIELDRSLQRFLPTIDPSTNKAQLQHFLNSWIEYICFVRHLWVWEEIVKESTNAAFMDWYKQLSGESLSLALLKEFQNSYK
ncbi:MAG: hypothetical protein K0R51_552 [Cytophagaceae bacterium]|jgi:hypothetical protein|nr:hypothetical protein [Cytophagaceae bacterium]